MAIAMDERLLFCLPFLPLADNLPNRYPPQGNRYGGMIAVRHYTEQVQE
jgi:hypothetical protein